MKNILITGATGYLGSNLLKYLQDRYNFIAVVRRSSNVSKIHNLCKLIYVDELEGCFSESGIDIVLHLATNYCRDGAVNTLVMDNVVFPLGIAQMVKRYNVKQFVNIDTCLPTISEYSLSKKQFRDWLKFLEIPTKNLILQYFYGPNNTNGGFIPMLIELLALNQNVDLSIGIQKRDFIYIEDLISAIDLCLSLDLSSKFMDIEIGSGTSISIKDISLLAKQISGSSSTLNFGVIPRKPLDKDEYVANIKFLQGFGWNPKFDIKTGLTKIIRNEYE